MAYIKTIPPRVAAGQLAEAYQYMAQMCGYHRIPHVIQVFSLRPESMKRLIRVWELGMWMTEEPRAMLEMVAAAVSRFNNCHY
jgi:hypothetical protein